MPAQTDDLASPTQGNRRRRQLRTWYRHENRTFAWRSFTSPWHVLVAEMLLLRTRADVVAKHIGVVIDRFPTPKAMADEDLSAVVGVLRPFGLRWRPRRLHELAIAITSDHGGQVP